MKCPAQPYKIKRTEERANRTTTQGVLFMVCGAQRCKGWNHLERDAGCGPETRPVLMKKPRLHGPGLPLYDSVAADGYERSKYQRRPQATRRWLWPAVSTYADAAILALPHNAPFRQWRLLAALGTIKPNPVTGTIQVSQPALVQLTGMATATVQRAREDLIGLGLLKYRAGSGRGALSQFLVTAPELPKLEKKGAKPKALTSGPANLSAGRKVLSQPRKGTKPKALTSGNATQRVRTQCVSTRVAPQSEREQAIATIAERISVTAEQAAEVYDSFEEQSLAKGRGPISWPLRFFLALPDDALRAKLPWSWDNQQTETGYEPVAPPAGGWAWNGTPQTGTYG